MGLGGKGDAGKKASVISMKEVSQHNTPDDAWLVVQGKVYDVSGWQGHPGGMLMFSHAGYVATDTFSGFHPPAAYDKLAEFYIGDLAASDADLETSPFEADFRQVKAGIRAAGLHKASTPYYLWKVFSTNLILAAAVALVLSSQSFSVHMLASVLVALYWQQCGWLSHDILHHQVFKHRWYGDLLGYFCGNVCQGFSVSWWKAKHNLHHAVPNLLSSKPRNVNDGDPDIDTAPILSWTAYYAGTDSAVARFLLRNQAFTYFPILFFARWSWLIFSLLYVVQPSTRPAGYKYPERLRNPAWEFGSLTLYYAWFFSLLACMPLSHAVAFALSAQCVCGLFLAVAFGVGHNGMEMFPFHNRPGFAEMQIRSTRNVHGSWLVGWFMGGLHLQVEHHLVPWVPRHNLHKVRELIEPLCVKHGIPYHSTTLWDGTLEVLSHLSSVSMEVMRTFPAM